MRAGTGLHSTAICHKERLRDVNTRSAHAHARTRRATRRAARVPPPPEPQETAAPAAAEKTFYQDVSWSRDGSRIAFTAMRHAGEKEMRSGIYVMRSDGTEPTRVTDEATLAFYSAFSSDGARVVFTSKREGDAFFHIYSVKIDGTDLKRLCEQEAFFARPSPDGRKIAFIAGRFPESAVYVMNSDGTGLVKLTK